METNEMMVRLRRVAPRCAQGAGDVTGLRMLTGGASQAIWSFDVHTAQGAVPLVMRCARHWSADSEARGPDMATEAALLQVAKSGDVPVPGVRTILQPEDELGEGYVMDRVEGETQGRKLARAPAFDAVRPRLAYECGAIMARIHALPVAALPPLRTGWAAGECHEWVQRYRRGGSQRPVLELAVRWLQANAPEPSGPATLVHGDFRNGNLMIGPDGVRAVLDWELAHVGDPMEDLGYFCVNAWRFGNIDQPAGGFGSREQLFAGYESVSGHQVDPARVHFWEVFGTFKWGVSCDSMGHAFIQGTDPRLERAAVGRRASETEIDLLQLLAPRT
ncbi:MAG: phosphotransferase family protein [Burkholderiales bacterium]